MTAKPMLFNTAMVKAILAGQKTETRRAIKPRYRDGEVGFQIITNSHTGEYVRIEYVDEWESETRWMRDPCRPGDNLYVRETWSTTENGQDYLYRADAVGNAVKDRHGRWYVPTWRPSLHMPREAARLFLHVTNVRVKRLNDMTEQDAIREGFPDSPADTDSPLARFSALWDRLVDPRDWQSLSWSANPWVWVISFERYEYPGAQP